MYTDSDALIITCDCGNRIQIKRVWYPGGDNDYGSFVVRCNQCKKTLDIYIGRDVVESDVVCGAELLEKKIKD